MDEAGLVHYQRHHCGYCVGIGFPPSWTGGNTVTWLRRDSDLENREGMSFHIHSWLMGTGSGDFFLSNTVLLGPDGPEVLTGTPVFAANWVSDGLRHPSGQSESRRAETVFSGFPEVLVASSESTAGRFGRAADPA